MPGYERFDAVALDHPGAGILRIRLGAGEASGAKRGALSEAAHTQLAQIWSVLEDDAETRCVLVTGQGDDFCAGGDLDDQRAALDDPARLLETMDEARRIVYGMLDCAKPVVTAARGWVVGAGLALLVLADISLATPEARLADGHTQIGLVAGDHAAIIWPLLCGVAKAKYHLLTGEPLSGAEAERIGLIARTVPDADLEDRALELAGRLAAGPVRATQWTKSVINQWVRNAAPSFEASLALEMLGVMGPEGREGISAFTEKRAPRWR